MKGNEKEHKVTRLSCLRPGGSILQIWFPGYKKETMITSYDVKTSFVEGAHEQLEPNDGVNDDDEQY